MERGPEIVAPASKFVTSDFKKGDPKFRSKLSKENSVEDTDLTRQFRVNIRREGLDQRPKDNM